MARTVVVGDSLGVGTTPHLHGDVKSNVRVGRSSADGVNALAGMVKGADRIVLDLGTNDGSARSLVQSVQRAKQLANGRPIYVMTVNGPGAASKNAALRGLAGGNVHLVDWAGHSKGLLGGDGIHATAAGYRRRAALLASAMGSTAPTPAKAAAVPAAAPVETADRLQQIAGISQSFATSSPLKITATPLKRFTPRRP